MRITSALLVAAAIAVSSPISAQWIDPSGKRLADNDQMKAQGNFGVQIVLTASEDAFRNTWANAKTPPNLQTTDRIRPGGKISAMVLFHGCVAGAAGVCNALVRFTIVEPDGMRSPAGEGPLWTAQPAAKGQILLSSTSMTVGFGKGDKLGKYKVLATAIDMEANKQVDVSASFALQ